MTWSANGQCCHGVADELVRKRLEGGKWCLSIAVVWMCSRHMVVIQQYSLTTAWQRNRSILWFLKKLSLSFVGMDKGNWVQEVTCFKWEADLSHSHACSLWKLMIWAHIELLTNLVSRELLGTKSGESSLCFVFLLLQTAGSWSTKSAQMWFFLCGYFKYQKEMLTWAMRRTLKINSVVCRCL